MTAQRITIIVASLLIANIGYYLYTPMPDDAAEPWKQRAVLAVHRMISSLSTIGEFIGYDSYLNVSRALHGMLASKEDGRVVDGVDIEDVVFDGVKVRLYKPRGLNRPSPGVVFYHGGGWVIFDPARYNLFTSTVADQARVIIASIDYRLAPEHVYPAAHDDCVTATKHFLRNAAEYGVDPNRIAVAGDSAGGNLAMSVLLKLMKDSDQNLASIKAQVLIYPLLQAIDLSTPSYQKYSPPNSPTFMSDTLLATVCSFYSLGHLNHRKEFYSFAHTKSFKKSPYSKYLDYKLLPAKFQKEQRIFYNIGRDETFFSQIKHIILDPHFSPLMATDEELRRIPKTYIITAEYDVLRDDGFMLAKRLRSNWVTVEHRHWEGDGHGFLSLSAILHNGKLALLDFSNYLKHNL